MADRPDGGWGWVVAIAAFFTSVIVDGVKYSFGIMFVELVDAFKSNNSATSWIISIQVGFLCLSGPVVAGLVNRYGCRTVAGIGAVLSCVGFIASSFASSLYAMYATFGGIAGFGFAMMTVPVSVTLARYFDKHLALATGIAAMGSGVGTLAFNPISKILIDNYSWRGTLLIEGGFILNGLVCAFILIQPKGLGTLQKYVEEDEHCLYSKKERPKVSIPLLETRNTEDVMLAMEADNEVHTIAGIVKHNSTDHTINSGKENELNIDDERVYTSDDTFIEVTHSKSGENGELLMDTSKESRRWLSLEPLKNAGFIILVSSNTLIEFGLNTPFAFLPDMMRQRGYTSQDAVWIMFIIGLLSTVSRLIVGMIADLRCVNRVMLCKSLVLVTGVWIILCPFCFNFESFVAFAVLFGMSAGSSNSLRGILIPDLFGVDKIADFYGIAMFFSGISAFLGLPIAGALYDATGNYVTPFVVAGVEQLASGLLLFLIPVVQKCCHQ